MFTRVVRIVIRMYEPGYYNVQHDTFVCGCKLFIVGHFQVLKGDA